MSDEYLDDRILESDRGLQKAEDQKNLERMRAPSAAKMRELDAILPAEDVEDKPWYDDAAEAAKQLIGGAVVDLPEMAAQTVRSATKEGGFANRAATWLMNNRANRVMFKAFAPDMEGRGGLATAIINGARGVAPAVAPVALGAMSAPLVGARAAIAAGSLASGVLYGGSAYQDAYDQLIEEGADEATAKKAAYRAGAISGVGTAGANALGMKLLGKGFYQQPAKKIAKTLAAIPATQITKDLLAQTAVQRGRDEAGIDRESSILAHSIPTRLAETAILAPLGLMGTKAKFADKYIQSLKPSTIGTFGYLNG
jgi:hypothetical protein